MVMWKELRRDQYICTGGRDFDVRVSILEEKGKN